jgi:cellulose biosynthesis protein BcsQ
LSVSILAFFNNKGGVGKTTIVYHLAWMYADLGMNAVAVDLDPQANLTAAFLSEERMMQLWPDGDHPATVYGSVQPLIRGIGDVKEPHLERISQRLMLVPGDLALSSFEDQLSEVWPKCLDGDERAFRVTSAFWRIMQAAAEIHKAQIILVDLGPNLGAINRAALISCDYVVVPLSPDLFSLQGLRNLGPRLRQWRTDWKKRLEVNPAEDLRLPSGMMQPVGYVIQQHSVRLDRPVQAYDRWIAQIPSTYREAVLNEPITESLSFETDPDCLALLKHYRSLMPMAQQARKPMFHLRPADGALGSHFQAAQSARKDFSKLAAKIAERINVVIPERQPTLQF